MAPSQMADQRDRDYQGHEPLAVVLDQACELATCPSIGDPLEVPSGVLQDVGVAADGGLVAQVLHEELSILGREGGTGETLAVGDQAAQPVIELLVVRAEEELLPGMERHDLSVGPASGEEVLKSAVGKYPLDEVLCVNCCKTDST